MAKVLTKHDFPSVRFSAPEQWFDGKIRQLGRDDFRGADPHTKVAGLKDRARKLGKRLTVDCSQRGVLVIQAFDIERAAEPTAAKRKKKRKR